MCLLLDPQRLTAFEKFRGVVSDGGAEGVWPFTLQCLTIISWDEKELVRLKLSMFRERKIFFSHFQGVCREATINYKGVFMAINCSYCYPISGFFFPASDILEIINRFWNQNCFLPQVRIARYSWKKVNPYFCSCYRTEPVPSSEDTADVSLRTYNAFEDDGNVQRTVGNQWINQSKDFTNHCFTNMHAARREGPLKLNGECFLSYFNPSPCFSISFIHFLSLSPLPSPVSLSHPFTHIRRLGPYATVPFFFVLDHIFYSNFLKL